MLCQHFGKHFGLEVLKLALKTNHIDYKVKTVLLFLTQRCTIKYFRGHICHVTAVSLVWQSLTCERLKHVFYKENWQQSVGCSAESSADHVSKLTSRTGSQKGGKL